MLAPSALLRIGLAAASVALAAGPSAASGTVAAPNSGDWNFRVSLDGKPIGEHRFSVSTHGDEREVVSDANFAVKILGFTAYHYRHKATERWHGNCLAGLASATDDDGKNSSVNASAGTQALDGCVMSFAYWNPAIQLQTRLLNAQTGKVESVRIEPIGSTTIDVHGKPCAATGLRIVGPGQPIDVWYSAEGEWIGLDSTVGGGHKLSYRLP
jgi:hypothetical protein